MTVSRLRRLPLKVRNAAIKRLYKLASNFGKSTVPETIRPVFDSAFYLRRYPDIAESGADPVEHYCRFGWKEGRDPTPNFSTAHYLESNPDVASAGINPFWHYLVAGKDEGRSPVGRCPAASPVPITPKEPRILVEAETIRSAFDTEFYLKRYPDIAESETDPVEHYCEFGWKERRNPTPEFSTDYYLESNPDVSDAGINPFWHYVVAGKTEDRMPCHPAGQRAATLTALRPLEETVRKWRKQKSPESMLRPDALAELILNARGGAVDFIVISISHDNYHEVSGGVQNCVQQEEKLAKERDAMYLNLHPYQPLPRLAHLDEDPDPVVALVLEGRIIGTTRTSTVAEAVRALADRVKGIEVVIHHLMGHCLEQIADLVLATGRKDCRLWLHDFFTICPSYALQRNDVSFCGGPRPGSNACSLCLYGEERESHLDRMRRFFETVEVHALAPSKFMAEYWTKRSDLPVSKVSTHPHLTLRWKRTRKVPPQSADGTGRIIVAFVGFPAAHKGWPAFEKLVAKSQHGNFTYDFVYFGASEIRLAGVETIPVQVTKENPEAMIRAIATRGVDFVLHWASCAETFSFSTIEAIAGGAYVVTNVGSGNVAATVRRTGRGAVLEDEGELEAFFRDGRIESIVSELRAKRQNYKASLTRSKMTFAVMDSECRP